jgi:hypothetical protein
MTAEIAHRGRSAVWVPYVVRRAERTFRKPVVPLVTDAAGGVRRPRSSVWYRPPVGRWPEPRTCSTTAACLLIDGASSGFLADPRIGVGAPVLPSRATTRRHGPSDSDLAASSFSADISGVRSTGSHYQSCGAE